MNDINKIMVKAIDKDFARIVTASNGLYWPADTSDNGLAYIDTDFTPRELADAQINALKEAGFTIVPINAIREMILALQGGDV